MAALKRICFCCGLRAGSMFVATYSLLSSAFFIALLLIRNIGYKIVEESIVHKVVTYGSFVLFGLLMLVSVGLIIGVHRESRWMFIPWLVQTLVALMFATGTIAWFISDTINRETKIQTWEICLITFHTLNLICTTYCILGVVSLFQELSNTDTEEPILRRERRSNPTPPANGTPTPPLTSAIVNGVPRPPALSAVISPPPYASNPPPYTTFPHRGMPNSRQASAAASMADLEVTTPSPVPGQGTEQVAEDNDNPPPSYTTFPRGVPPELARSNNAERVPDPLEAEFGEVPPYTTFPRGVPDVLLQAQEMEGVRPRSIHPPPAVIEEEEEEAEEDEEEEEEGEEEEEEEEEDEEEEDEEGENEGEDNDEEEEEEGEEEEDECEETEEKEADDIEPMRLQENSQNLRPMNHTQQLSQSPDLVVSSTNSNITTETASGSPSLVDQMEDVRLSSDYGTVAYNGRSSGSSADTIVLNDQPSYGGPIENDRQPLLPARDQESPTDPDTDRSGDERPPRETYSVHSQHITEQSAYNSSNLEPSSPQVNDIGTSTEPENTDAVSNIGSGKQTEAPTSPSTPESSYHELPPPLPAKLYTGEDIASANTDIGDDSGPSQSGPNSAVIPMPTQKAVTCPVPTLGPASSEREIEIREIKKRLKKVAADCKENEKQIPQASKYKNNFTEIKKLSIPVIESEKDIREPESSITGVDGKVKAATSNLLRSQHELMESNVKSGRPVSIEPPPNHSRPRPRINFEAFPEPSSSQTRPERSGPPVEAIVTIPPKDSANWERYRAKLERQLSNPPTVTSGMPQGIFPTHNRNTHEKQHDSQQPSTYGAESSRTAAEWHGVTHSLAPSLDESKHYDYRKDHFSVEKYLNYDSDHSPRTQWADSLDKRGRYKRSSFKERKKHDRLRLGQTDKVRTRYEASPKMGDVERHRIEEKQRLRYEEFERQRHNERFWLDEKERRRYEEKLRFEEKERQKFNERDRDRDRLIRSEDRDKIWFDERDRYWDDERDYMHHFNDSISASSVNRQALPPPSYIPHAKRLSREKNDPYLENWKYSGGREANGSPRPERKNYRGKKKGYNGERKYHGQDYPNQHRL